MTTYEVVRDELVDYLQASVTCKQASYIGACYGCVVQSLIAHLREITPVPVITDNGESMRIHPDDCEPVESNYPPCPLLPDSDFQDAANHLLKTLFDAYQVWLDESITIEHAECVVITGLVIVARPFLYGGGRNYDICAVCYAKPKPAARLPVYESVNDTTPACELVPDLIKWLRDHRNNTGGFKQQYQSFAEALVVRLIDETPTPMNPRLFASEELVGSDREDFYHHIDIPDDTTDDSAIIKKADHHIDYLVDIYDTWLRSLASDRHVRIGTPCIGVLFYRGRIRLTISVRVDSQDPPAPPKAEDKESPIRSDACSALCDLLAKLPTEYTSDAEKAAKAVREYLKEKLGAKYDREELLVALYSEYKKLRFYISKDDQGDHARLCGFVTSQLQMLVNNYKAWVHINNFSNWHLAVGLPTFSTSCICDRLYEVEMNVAVWKATNVRETGDLQFPQ